MKGSEILSSMAVVLGLISPIASSPISGRALPFHLIVSTPTRPTFAPVYLHCSGSTTSDKSVASTYTLSDDGTRKIYCNGLPIGAPEHPLGCRFEATFGHYPIETAFTFDENNHLHWTNEQFTAKNNEAIFGLKMHSGDESVYAYFDGMSTADWVPADLILDLVKT